MRDITELLTIYISRFPLVHGLVVGLDSKYDNWYRTHHTGVVSLHHGVARSPHILYSPNIANPSVGPP